MSAPSIWAVVLNWNGWQDTLRCIESLRRQTPVPPRILLVDNGSTDDSLKHFEPLASAVDLLVLPENTGFAGGMNRGIEVALAGGATHVLIVNNDAEVEPKALSHLLEPLEAVPEAAMAVPTIFYREGGGIWYAGGSLKRWAGVASHNHRPMSDEPQPVTFATGCCMLWRAESVRAVGGFREDFFLYFEDVDLSERLRVTGQRILYVPTAKVWHAVGASAGSERDKMPAQDYYDTRNGLVFILERLTGAVRLGALLYFFAVRMPRKLLRIVLRARTPGASLKAVMRGVRDASRRRMGRYRINHG